MSIVLEIRTRNKNVSSSATPEGFQIILMNCVYYIGAPPRGILRPSSLYGEFRILPAMYRLCEF